MSKQILALLAALCLALMVLAACGGDDDDASDDPDTDATATAEADEGENEATDEPEATEDNEPTDAPEPVSGGIDACELITNEEAAAVIGGATDEPVSSQIGENFNQCLWRIQGGGDLDAAVVVQAAPDKSAEDYEEQVADTCPEGILDPNPVAGIGDAANECIALIVLSGDVIFAVTILTDDIDAAVADQEELARTIIGRLP